MNEKLRTYFKKYLYGGLIAIIITIALIVMPMFDPNGRLGLEFPNTSFGWIAYIVIRMIVGIMVYCIFILFDLQGKSNILDDPKYVEAFQKLYTTYDKKYIPLSPTAYKARTYGVKALTLSISTIGLAFVVMECVLQYNYTLLLTYVLSMFTGLISGLVQMKKAEIYWTEEFPKWVDYHILEIKERDERELAEMKFKEIERTINE